MPLPRTVVLPLLLLVAGGCTRREVPRAPRLPPLVTVARAERQDVPVTVEAPVELRPLFQADVGAKSLGYLDAVFVDRGDVVRKGQFLALVRPSDLPDQLAAAREQLAQARASVGLARLNAGRVKQLVPQGAASAQEEQQTASALEAALAGEASAQAQLAALAVRLGETKLTAPMGGVVAARRLDPGALVGPTSGAILTVMRTDVLRVFLPVSERKLRGLAVGREAFVTVDALPDRRFVGKVVRLAPALDPVTRTLEAEVQLHNDGGELRPGMYGRGTVVLDVHKGALTVPAGAIVRHEAGNFVYLVTGTTVRRQPVTLGVEAEEWVEVTRGLHAGDDLVTAGVEGLADGALVRPAPLAAAKPALGSEAPKTN